MSRYKLLAVSGLAASVVDTIEDQLLIVCTVPYLGDAQWTEKTAKMICEALNYRESSKIRPEDYFSKPGGVFHSNFDDKRQEKP